MKITKSQIKEIVDSAISRIMLKEGARFDLKSLVSKHAGEPLPLSIRRRIVQVQQVVDEILGESTRIHTFEFGESDNEDADGYNFDLDLKSRNPILEDDVEEILKSFARVCEIEDVIENSDMHVTFQFTIPLQ